MEHRVELAPRLHGSLDRPAVEGAQALVQAPLHAQVQLPLPLHPPKGSSWPTSGALKCTSQMRWRWW